MPIKSVKMKISKNKKMCFLPTSQGSLDPKIRFLAQKIWSVARVQTDRQTHTHRDTKLNTKDTLSGFQEFFLQPIIKDWSNKSLTYDWSSCCRWTVRVDKLFFWPWVAIWIYSANVLAPSAIPCTALQFTGIPIINSVDFNSFARRAVNRDASKSFTDILHA